MKEGCKCPLRRAQQKSSQGKWTPVPRKGVRCVTYAVLTSWVSKKKKCINFSWNVMEPHSLSSSIQAGNPKPTDHRARSFLSTWQQSSFTLIISEKCSYVLGLFIFFSRPTEDKMTSVSSKKILTNAQVFRKANGPLEFLKNSRK